MDEIERRVWLFAVSFTIGALGAHIFGARLTNTVPSVHFFQPFVLGLLVDTELTPAGLDFYNDRKRLFGVAAAGGIVLPMFLTPYVLGGTYFAPIVMTIAHSAFIAFHFQLVIASQKQKNFGASEAQLAYVIGFALLQLVVAVLFASPELPKATAQ
ncbi:Protein W06D4.2 [Aphelenchoides avenae]|nr:Protein W06D4.2 [Aphelenchus avenae]